VAGISGQRQAGFAQLAAEPAGDVRLVVSAASEDALHEALHRRLAGAGPTLQLPPLAERVEDVPLLARHFIAAICEVNHLPPMQIAPETLALLERYPWPQNVRELRNAIEQAAILAGGGVIRPRDLPDRIQDWRPPVTRERPEPARATAAAGFREAKREVVEAFERAYLRDLLERHGGNVTSAAQRAKMLRSALQRLLRKYGLRSADFRSHRREAAGERDRITAE
jgi:DNA-binding NtrC family response regulator